MIRYENGKFIETKVQAYNETERTQYNKDMLKYNSTGSLIAKQEINVMGHNMLILEFIVDITN